MLLPGRLHREAAGDELGPDVASRRGKAKALSSEIGVNTDSWPPAGDGRPPMRPAGLMPESNLEKALSAPHYDRRSGSLPPRRHGEPADASCHARSASIGDRRSSGGEQAWPGCSSTQPAADHISPQGFDASATALVS